MKQNKFSQNRKQKPTSASWPAAAADLKQNEIDLSAALGINVPLPIKPADSKTSQTK